MGSNRQGRNSRNSDGDDVPNPRRQGRRAHNSGSESSSPFDNISSAFTPALVEPDYMLQNLPPPGTGLSPTQSFSPVWWFDEASSQWHGNPLLGDDATSGVGGNNMHQSTSQYYQANVSTPFHHSPLASYNPGPGSSVAFDTLSSSFTEALDFPPNYTQQYIQPGPYNNSVISGGEFGNSWEFEDASVGQTSGQGRLSDYEVGSISINVGVQDEDGGEHEDGGEGGEGVETDVQTASELLLIYDEEQTQTQTQTLVRLVQVNPIPVIKVNGLSTFQRLISSLMYYSTSKSKQPSRTYSRLEEFCHQNNQGEVSTQLVLNLSTEQFESFGVQKRFVKAIQNFASMYEAELSEERWMNMDETVLYNKLTGVTGLSEGSAFFMMLFGLLRLDFWPWHVYEFRKALKAYLQKDKLPTKEEARDNYDKWSPYRAVAAYIIWRAVRGFTK